MRSFASVRNTIKPLDSRKTFLVDFYADILKTHPLVLVAHRNNLTKTESSSYRRQIQEVGGQLVVVRNNLLKVYLRAADQADPAAVAKSAGKSHGLFPFLNGPTALIVFKENDPTQLKKLIKVLAAAKEKLFVVGAKVGDDVYDLSRLNEYKELPSKPELQAQLVGLLNMCGGYGLTKTLGSASNVLHLTLKSHAEHEGGAESAEKSG